MIELFMLILIAGTNGGQISRFKVSNPSQLHVDPLQELKCARKYRDSDETGIKLEVSTGICLQDDSDFTEQGYVYLDKTHVFIKYNPPVSVVTHFVFMHPANVHVMYPLTPNSSYFNSGVFPNSAVDTHLKGSQNSVVRLHCTTSEM